MTTPKQPTTEAAILLRNQRPDITALEYGRTGEPILVAIERQAREADAAGLLALRSIVDEQAEDEGLWFIARTAPEGYLQQELRRLHAAIEDTAPAAAEIEARIEQRFTERLLAAADAMQGEHHANCPIRSGKPCDCWHLGDVYVVRNAIREVRRQQANADLDDIAGQIIEGTIGREQPATEEAGE